MAVKVGESFVGSCTGFYLGELGQGHETMTLRGFVGKNGSRWCAIDLEGIVVAKCSSRGAAADALRNKAEAEEKGRAV
jgi:hypothetical protein